jgi:hypothetical protein
MTYVSIGSGPRINIPSAVGKSADCRLKKPKSDRLAKATLVIIRSDMNTLNIDDTDHGLARGRTIPTPGILRT